MRRIDINKTGQNIKSLIKSNDLTIKELSEKFGFSTIGTRKKYYNNTDNAVIMTMKIN